MFSPVVASADNVESRKFDGQQVSTEFRGRVGEWLKPADCKSAAPCGLRRFESFPVHQDPAGGKK